MTDGSRAERTAEQFEGIKPHQIERFWSLFAHQPSGCREWQGSYWNKGYGRIKINGHDWAMHRLSWMLTHGFISNPLLFVCHQCDNPRCGHPDHLFLGTVTTNNRDSSLKKRSAVHRYPERYRSHPGEESGNAKLTDEIVRDIRARYRPGKVSQQRLADEYGVKQTTISKVLLGTSWRHVA